FLGFCVDDRPDRRKIFEILCYNSVVEEKEHLQVYLRVRPFTAVESNTGEAQGCVGIESADTVLVKAPGSSSSLSARQSSASADRSLLQTGQRFHFTQVYGPDTTQKQLYDGTVKDLVKDVLSGGNSLVFTYGVTNAGKTFTFLGPEADGGILPRSLSTVFNSIEGRVYRDISVRPHRCREYTRLTKEQQAEQILFKRSLFKQLREVGSVGGTPLTSDARLSLDVGEHTRFSVWVSFCEIYNESIHDLLEALPSSSRRRTVLRLSQDVKGNSFVKDLRWVHVDSAEEAYSVLKLGKKNQSFSSTKLNQLSSRSHSIFSIRILRIEDIGTPRVSTISELCLCDLAGSERCAKTQNKGDRLKEAGNINNSLLILGKCINALRHNQQAKLLQHVPFRESKLTHYLQSFLCGRGRACMIVNINQCASMYDETLHVLKFSAVAQKVVVLSGKTQQVLPERMSEGSFLMDSTEDNPKRRRRSSLSVWETSLEDVQVSAALLSTRVTTVQMALLAQVQVQLKQELAQSLEMEARIREEISKEFSDIFSHMQKDYDFLLPSQVSSEKTRGDKVSQQLSEAQNQLGKLSSEISSKAHQIQSLTQEVGSLKEELQTSVSSSGLSANLLKDEISKLRANLTSEKEQNKRKTSQITQLEQEGASAKEQLALEKLMSEQKLTELNEKLRRQSTSRDELESLKKKLWDKEESSRRSLVDLKAKLEFLESEKKQFRAKLEEEKQAKEKLLEQDLRLYEHQEATDKLKADLELANGKCAALQDCNRQTDDHGGKIREMERALEEKEKKHGEKLAEAARKCEDAQRRLAESEREAASLKRSLDQREQEQSQALQETRRKEAERRRELLAKAEEAIAQKDAELEKKNAEINRYLVTIEPFTGVGLCYELNIKRFTSVSCPSVLDSSEISTENGRTRRFPRPELEISFSPLQPNRMALRRQGEESAVTVKITRQARKRKSTEMDKVEAENRRNTRTKVTPKLTPQQEVQSRGYSRHDSQSSVRSRKEGTLQKIGDFLQSSPTLLGSKGLCLRRHSLPQVKAESAPGCPYPGLSFQAAGHLTSVVVTIKIKSTSKLDLFFHCTIKMDRVCNFSIVTTHIVKPKKSGKSPGMLKKIDSAIYCYIMFRNSHVDAKRV
uniref:Kinesin motor domain-containing protein n=1 Tax=Neogobius melanostomus TaxID=47308 RepID=A0A8C6WIG0_9GOBI